MNRVRTLALVKTTLCGSDFGNRTADTDQVREETDEHRFYELRVSVDNEVRVILFSADNENINLASSVILLNGFVKKSTKDYDKEITKAINILRKLL